MIEQQVTKTHSVEVVSQVGPGGSAAFATCTCEARFRARYTRALAAQDAAVHLAALGDVRPTEPELAEALPDHKLPDEWPGAEVEAEAAAIEAQMEDDPFEPWFERLQAIVFWRHDEVTDSPDVSTASLLMLWKAAVDARKVLLEFTTAVADKAWQERKLHYGPNEVAGFGVVELRKGTKRTEWEHDAINARVLQAVAAELGYEVGPVEQVLTAFRKFTQQPSWSTPALKALDGFDLDEYCKQRPGQPTLHTP